MLNIRRIEIHVQTDHKSYTSELEVREGLNVILAENSSGKSTLLQAIIYGLGLERMLGPNLEIPLPYATHDRIHSSPTEPFEKVLSSHVILAIANSAGGEAIIRRDIVGGADRKLVHVTADTHGRMQERDFFVHDAGAAQREDGFHRFLVDFAGWDLPLVSTFDGREVPLYLETLFPMFFVEQKRGWSTIQGPFPTFLRIQDVNRRVLEFLLDLDAGRTRRRLSELRVLISQLKAQWDAARTELGKNLPAGIRLGQLPAEPTIETTQSASFPVEAFRESEWRPAAEFTAMLKEEIGLLDREVTESKAPNARELEAELAAEREALEKASVQAENVRQEFSLVQADSHALAQRIATLSSDLARNQDAAKLEKLGSKLGRAAHDHVCPTCHQELTSELLPTISFAAMAVDENISFIKSQLSLCEAARASAASQIRSLQNLYSAVTNEISERQTRIRQLRGALVRPDQSISRTTIEKIVALQARIDAVRIAQENADQAADNLRAIAISYVNASNELKTIRNLDVSGRDRAKIDQFATALRNELKSFGFKSFNSDEVQLSDDNFRPIVARQEDGGIIERELGFEMSASDGIRMKWAYYLALMNTTAALGGNHAGLLVFDEPGQQAMEMESLRTFLTHCAGSISGNRQIIVGATTEKVVDYADELKALGTNVVKFDGLVLQPH